MKDLGDLTKGQERVLSAINQLKSEHALPQESKVGYASLFLDDGWAPSVREIAKEVGVRSAGTIAKHLRGLEELGYITRRRGHRAIEVNQMNRRYALWSFDFFTATSKPIDIKKGTGMGTLRRISLDPVFFAPKRRRKYYVVKVGFEDRSGLQLIRGSVFFLRTIKAPGKATHGMWCLITRNRETSIALIRFSANGLKVAVAYHWKDLESPDLDFEYYNAKTLRIHGVVDAAVMMARGAEMGAINPSRRKREHM